MTERKERILAVALELFANEGFNRTSTKRIAEQAEVSEGLLFKHFGNKKGILEAIIDQLGQKMKASEQMLSELDDPKEVLSMSIHMPFELTDEEADFWRLQFKLKWDVAYENPNKMDGYLNILTQSFEKLGYENSEIEAVLFSNQIEMLMLEILRGNREKIEPVRDFLLSKYVS